ncbi:probable protein phosphatase 2C 8 [Salvia hispanica]|uniref:probable protein phosphatase 2C 8 n=1 Tax=Salvia hispanica TaxID=49212 RepID=UPI00200915C8|nr:probable protein phosphatase 2C 8 [Salvia hispanica]
MGLSGDILFEYFYWARRTIKVAINGLRIEGCGGKVINWNGLRVSGVLATSRSIGDEYLKPYVITDPEVKILSRTKLDEFLILGSDGLWDVISNEMACQVARRCLEGRIRRSSGAGYTRTMEAAAVLVELAMARGSCDNISVVVVDLSRNQTQTAAYSC